MFMHFISLKEDQFLIQKFKTHFLRSSAELTACPIRYAHISNTYFYFTFQVESRDCAVQTGLEGMLFLTPPPEW